MNPEKTISLLPLQVRHLELTRSWANDPELMRLLNRADFVAEAEHEEWFKRLSTREDCVYFAIETVDGNRHIGNIWLGDIDRRHRRAEIRVMIGDKTQLGRGLGTKAIGLISDYGFGELKLHKLYAYVLSINPRARSAFQKAGFAVEGVLRQDRWTGDGFTDVFLLGKLNERDADPA